MDDAVQISQLTKIYKGGFQALKGIDLTVRQGDFYGLLGPNGAGKSTTIGIVAGLVNKTGGQVRLLGYDLDKHTYQLRRQLGVVPQEFNFNQFEKVQNIVRTQAGYYGVRSCVARQQTQKYLKQLGLWDKRDQPARHLSGGMKRRLMIARALVHSPKVLILDEPTAGVDIELRRSMWRFLREINEQGITIILTTHYLEEAEQLCNHLGIISQGELIANTSMRDLLKQLNRETFVLDPTHLLQQAPQLPGYQLRLRADGALEVDIERHQGLNQLFALLSEQGITIGSLRNKANRLEELFMSLVSKP